jgi:hypothetical protein
MDITLNPTLSYSKNFDLYDVDGSILNIYFTSALIMSNDNNADLYGVESNFNVLYTTTGGIDVKYISMTNVVVSHDTGSTEVRIPGYQKTIYYTIDGATQLSVSPNITTYNQIDYYKVNCFRLCWIDTSSDSFMFLIRPPYLSYLDTGNSSIFTNAVINGVVGQNLAFNLVPFAFSSDVVAYITTDNTLEIGGQLTLIGLGTSISQIDSSMIIS